VTVPIKSVYHELPVDGNPRSVVVDAVVIVTAAEFDMDIAC
jgi:hypothetical protein